MGSGGVVFQVQTNDRIQIGDGVSDICVDIFVRTFDLGSISASSCALYIVVSDFFFGPSIFHFHGLRRTLATRGGGEVGAGEPEDPPPKKKENMENIETTTYEEHC